MDHAAGASPTMIGTTQRPQVVDDDETEASDGRKLFTVVVCPYGGKDLLKSTPILLDNITEAVMVESCIVLLVDGTAFVSHFLKDNPTLFHRQKKTGYNGCEQPWEWHGPHLSS